MVKMQSLGMEIQKSVFLFSCRLPLPPGAMSTVWQNEDRFIDNYFMKFKVSIIKIMPCVEGDRSDCQLEANSFARSRRLRSMTV